MSQKTLLRIPTGVKGLDELIEGGLVRGQVHLLVGGPGTGKTILASNFVYNAVSKLGEKAVYATFEESSDYFKRNLLGLKMDFQALEKAGKVKILDLEMLRGKGLESNIAYLLEVVDQTKSTILVIDSLTALLLACESQFEQRTFMKMMYKSLKDRDVTTFMTVSLTQTGKVGPEGFLSDSVMLLENSLANNEFKTRFLIQKMRGTDHSRRYHSVALGPELSIIRY
ncbi:MAG: AAA family ATPase [Nitrososphaerota archaeon]|nr:AAA family ATPase [Nitrososphaerota archaeon]